MSDAQKLSSTLAGAIAKAGSYTVTVDGRDAYPVSGVSYAADLVLTADHVLERDEGITITVEGGATETARVVGRDPGRGLALLRVEGAPLKPPQMRTDEPKVGELVLLVGRPAPGDVRASLGIISAAGGPLRLGHASSLERYLVTDAARFPGFSGGPLVDAEGALLGINLPGFSAMESIAVPTAEVRKVAEWLLQHGSVKRGYLGARSQVTSIPESLQRLLGRTQQRGLLLVGVEEGSPAAKAGLLLGDIIVAFNGTPTESHDELLSLFAPELEGTRAAVEVIRGGQRLRLEVTLDFRPMDTARGHMRQHRCCR